MDERGAAISTITGNLVLAKTKICSKYLKESPLTMIINIMTMMSRYLCNAKASWSAFLPRCAA